MSLEKGGEGQALKTCLNSSGDKAPSLSLSLRSKSEIRNCWPEIEAKILKFKHKNFKIEAKNFIIFTFM